MKFNFQTCINSVYSSSSYLLLLSLFIIISSSGYPSLVIEDDFFFYLKTASNLWDYGFVTFDGVNPTNGIHPLLFFFISIIYFLLDLIGIEDPKLCFIIYSVVYLSCIYYACSYLLKRKEALLLFTSLILFSIFMETVILGLLLCLFFIKPTRIVIFLIIFCRIDSIIILLPYLIYKLANNRKELLYFLFPFILGILATFFFNFLLDEIPISISSLSKMTWDASFADRIVYNFSSELFLGKLLFAVILFIYALKILLKENNKTGLLILLGISSFVIIHLVFSIFRNWYLSPLIIFSLFVILNNLDAVKNIKISLVFLVSWLTLYLLMYLSHDFYFYKKDRQISQEFIFELKNYINKTGYMIDLSGYPSYFSGVNIINGDGLINSFEFYKFKKNNLKDYFVKYGYPNFIVTSDKKIKVETEKEFFNKRYCFSWSSPESQVHKFTIYKECGDF